MSASPVNAALTQLIQSCRDDQEGFLTAAENVNDGELKLLFSEIAMQRLQFTDELRDLASRTGGSIEPSGTFAGAIQRGWMNLKAVMNGGDARSILTTCDDSEASTLSKYDTALGNKEIPAEIQQVICKQFNAILPVHERIHLLRQKYGG